MGTSNFFEQIYNNTLINGVIDYVITEDLNDDDFSEIITIDYLGNVSIISGFDGSIIRSFEIVGDYSNHWIERIGTDSLDKETFLLIKSDKYNFSTELREVQLAVYSITESSEEIVWRILDESTDQTKEAYVLHEDLDGNLIEELILTERVQTALSTNEVRRIKIISIPDNEELAIFNIEYDAMSILTIPD
jgi:hypothetical protein